MTRTADLSKRFQDVRLPVAGVDDLRPRSDLTFKLLNDLTVEKANVHQSLLNGCLVRNCTFRGVRFSRCDLEQVQFQKCRFVDVNFGNVELTSAQIHQTLFENCSFESALISDCVWRNCTLENCCFRQAVIHASKFEQCRLVNNDLRGASVQLDTFCRCAFENMKLGDCTFLNHIMVHCTYMSIGMNAESIGSLFGITEKDLLTFNLVYLGQTVVGVAGTKSLLDSLESDYEHRRWFFMREVLRLNFERIPRVIGLDAALKALLWPSSLGAPLKVNDITFLEMIVSELFRRQQLPAMTALSFSETIRSLLRHSAGENFESGDKVRIRQLASRLQGILLEMLQQLAIEIEPLARRDRSVIVTLVFEEKPACDVVKLVGTIGDASGLRIRGRTAALREESGSYLLFLQTTVVTLAALQTALWLLNGCATQMMELKTRLQLVAQKHPPKVIRDRVLLPDQNIPKWMAVTVQSIFAKLTGDPARLTQIAADFSPENLKRIEVGKERPGKQPQPSVVKS